MSQTQARILAKYEATNLLSGPWFMSISPVLDSEWNQPSPAIPFRRRLRPAPPPAPLTPLLGRDDAVATATALLTGGDARLVTLVGPGGIGKTRLALDVAAVCASAFDGQVAWAPVATANTPETVAAALAQAVGVAEVGSAPTSEALKTALRDERLLLVVDNFEQALDAAPLLSDLLVACPGLSMVVTSRAVLRIAGERPLEVPPLATQLDPSAPAAPRARPALAALPPPSDPGAVPGVAPAVQLFVQRAAGVRPGFALTPESEPIVVEICRRLDGLPLAIELAAARVNHLPLPGLLGRLDRRLALLTSAVRGVPGRHRTMRDAIAWSYDLLTAEQQALFRRLAVFSGGCTLDAITAIATDLPDSLDSLGALVDNSLVRLESPFDAAARYRMLETVREFAVEQLAGDNDDAPRRRHAEYYLRLALRAELTCWGDAPGYLRTGIVREIPNLRAAQEWAVAHGEADTALRLTAAMFDPHRVTGDNVREQWLWTQRALALPGGSLAARVAAQTNAAHAAQARSNEFDARAMGEEALVLARQLGDELAIAKAAFALAIVRLHAGNVAGARELVAEALDLFRRLGASGRVGWTLLHLAYMDSHDAVDEGGDPAALARSLACYEEALAIFRAIGHPRGIARSLHGVAYLTFKQRDLPRALASTQEVLALDWEQRWPALFAYLEDIADIAGRVGRPATAARLYGAADAQRERLGLPIDPPFRPEYERDVAVARRALGEAAFAAGWAAGRAIPDEQAVAEALAVVIQPADAATVSLSPRELEVLRLLAGGLSDRAIADALFIGKRTVNTHVARVFEKLGVRNRAAAVTAAVAAGLLDPESVTTDTAESDYGPP
jgi:predicted ATPase/DNA-binding CsgD family transcriptional regulator